MRYNRKTAYVITPASTKPVTLTELKNYLRVDGSADDDMLTAFIAAATDQIERFLGRYLINTTIGYKMDGFSTPDDEKMIALGAGTHDAWIGGFTNQSGEFDLPHRPVSSITSIKTYDRSNTESTFSSSSYRLDGQGGRVYLNSGSTFPTDLRDREAVLVTFVCGYGSAASDVPAAIKQGVLMHAGAMYECRGGCDLSDACKAILRGYQIIDNMGFA